MHTFFLLQHVIVCGNLRGVGYFRFQETGMIEGFLGFEILDCGTLISSRVTAHRARRVLRARLQNLTI